jgi:hypothetical protein
MSIENWWPKLDAEGQDWLIQHNGEVVPADLLRRINRLGGLICTPANVVGEARPDGFHFSDEAVDWIEATANGEVPASGALAH